VPADRRDALFPDLSLRENLELARRVARAPSAESVEAVIDRLAIRARDADVPVRNLSGGNQQKVLIGRWLVGRINVLILAEPTRGVDIGVRADIHRLLRELAAGGLGILAVSFDAEEIEAIATRVHVMHDGRIAMTLDGPQRAHDILAAVAQAASGTGRTQA
jgi:ABC-type sugar transport system ATPase subunit